MSRVTGFILIMVLTCAAAGLPALGRDAIDQTGELGGIPFRVQVPPDWNRCLVMFAHGYILPGRPWAPMSRERSAVFLDRGFAVAESGYSRQGWAVEEGLAETEALRRYFCERYGMPDSTFITGYSMGGLIALASIELHPDAYDGALPMCGPLEPAIVFFKDRVFDMLVTFEALFGKALPSEYTPVIQAAGLPGQAIAQALASDTALAARFAAHWGIRQSDLPAIVSLYHLLYRELADRAGGNPIDNRNTYYADPELPADLNGAVRRYAAEQTAVDYVLRNYTPTGEIEDPVLAVHTTYDAGVPPQLPGFYNISATLKNNERRFVQMYVEAEGHCNIAPALVGEAFDALRVWTATGVRPQPGILR
jgi:pimeloyl-ACP methyl ester carboxylesterase